jgi:hypothetical protein
MTSDLVAGFAGWSTLMSRLSSVFTAPALEWRVDPGNWPAVAERRDGRPIGALIVAIGAVWLTVALRDLLSNGSPASGLGEAGGYLSLGVGIALVLWGCRVLLRRQTIRIDREGIHVQIRRLLGVTSWTEPLAGYRGVVWRSEPIRRRGARQTVHLIELWHEAPTRTVTLFSSTGDREARGLWQAWANRLGLAPIRWETADAPSVPGPSDAGLASSHRAHGA